MTLSRMLEVLKQKELSLDEYNNLSQEELAVISFIPGDFLCHQFIPLGDMVYMRSQAQTITYLENDKYEVHDSETHALMECEHDGTSFRPETQFRTDLKLSLCALFDPQILSA